MKLTIFYVSLTLQTDISKVSAMMKKKTFHALLKNCMKTLKIVHSK